MTGTRLNLISAYGGPASACGAYDTIGDDDMTPRWVVVESTPGYLPDDTDPATFEDHKSACEYMREEVARLVDFIAEGYDYEGPAAVVSWYDDGTGAYVTDPAREHDLGRIIEVLPIED